MIDIKIKRLDHGQDIPLPKYMSDHAAGMDLYAAVNEPMKIEGGARALIPTGIAIALPVGYEAQIRPRSGLAIKKGISVLNTPGTIDADYRGEIKIILMNHDTEPFIVQRGDRIAQMIIKEFIRGNFEEVTELPESNRSVGGFGHTGV